jgi:LacI family transcriptional regulator
LLSAIEEAATAAGQSILLGTYGESLSRQERVLRMLKEYRPDGMILCAAGGTAADDVEHLVAARIPVVQLSREVAGVELDFVGADDRRGTEAAVDHLVQLGHRRIAMICGTDGISTGRSRRQGYRAALARHGLPVDPGLIHDGYGTREAGLTGIRAVLAQPDPPTAAICFNDLSAFGAMLGLRHLGREAGKDFSIVGCDDVQEAAQWYPALTTIHNRQDEMGRKAAEMLIARIANPDAPIQRHLLEPRLVVRGSTVPPVA